MNSHAPPGSPGTGQYNHDDAFFAAATTRPQIQGLRDLGIRLNSRRTASLNPIRGVASAWIDQDDSGTYDPKESRATHANCQPRRAKMAKRENGQEDANREPKTRRDREIGYSLPMTFAFTSKNALNYLRSITPGPFDDGASSPDSDSGFVDADDSSPLTHRKAKKPNRLGTRETRADGLTIDQLTDGHPQRRGCKSCFQAGDDDCSLIAHAYKHPCVACEDAGIDCELIVPPEFKKVCERCKKKRISCSYKVDGGKGVKSCATCKEAGLACYAGPLRETLSKKFKDAQPTQATAALQATPALQSITAPQDTSALETDAARQVPISAPTRKFAACNQCRDEGLRCNLKKYQSGPCKNCKKKDETCEFILVPPDKLPSNLVPVPTGRSANKKPNKKRAIQKKPKSRGRAGKKKPLKGKKKGLKRRSRTALSHARSSKSRSTHGIAHTFIHTSFAHPISFNHVPAPNGTAPCSWCANPFFGPFGHGERMVEVIPWPNGHGYEEIGLDPTETNARGELRGGKDHRGYNQLGEERSRMCVPCTFERIYIMACQVHEMESMKDIDPRIYASSEDWYRAVVALENGDEEGSRLVLNAKWCSVCPAIAEYRCVAPQDDIIDDEFDEEERSRCGCGLLLCANCKDLLGKIEGEKRFARAVREMNVLDRLVRMVGSDKFHYTAGARADASFLTSDGELNQRLEHGFGQVLERDDSPAATRNLSE